jgi:aspartyl-tRNA(Asn)/glutamyl-tRNA(Gln) amidotransferase subunit A
MNIPFDIWRAAPRIRDGDLHPLDLVDTCLERIDQLDSTLRAWVVVDRDGARADADRLGAEAAAGRYRGPLHGVPIGVKDLLDVRGMPTRAGSQITDPNPVPEDSRVVAHLRDAGAILLGKTVTTEFAWIDPPPTRNPWNVSRTPGGSSSGSAAAVAANMCLAAVGSQTGGSLTRPASYCGVASCKPTWGLVSTEGILPMSRRLDHVGPIAQSVVDLAYMLDGMTRGHGLVDRFAKLLSEDKPPRLGQIAEFFNDHASPEIVEATTAALAALRRSGANIVTAALPDGFAEVHVMHRRIMSADTARVHAQRFPSASGQHPPYLRSLLEEGHRVTDEAYQEAVAHQERFQRAADSLFNGFDALVTPATPTTAPSALPTTGDPIFNSPWSYSGLPTVSIPCGVAPDGLPIALQLIGSRGDDANLLAVAAWCERKLEYEG